MAKVASIAEIHTGTQPPEQTMIKFVKPCDSSVSTACVHSGLTKEKTAFVQYKNLGVQS